MKIRTSFVSNSSSSSFVLLGKTMNFEDFVKSVKSAGFISQDQDAGDDEDYVDLWKIKDWIEDKTNGFVEVEGSGDNGDYTTVVAGAHPSNMKDSDKLKDFKQKIIDELNKVGIKANLSDIMFESGGSDASGISFIGSCG